jgi:predicted kinase
MPGKLIILIGPPAAGKSTWRQHFKGKTISTDAIRLDKFGVQYDPRFEPAVWRTAYRLLSQALATGGEVCFDATNVTRAQRKPLIHLGKKAEATIEAIVFLFPLEVLLARNAVRPPGKKVADAVIIKKFKQLEMPTFKEGFDKINIRFS